MELSLRKLLQKPLHPISYPRNVSCAKEVDVHEQRVELVKISSGFLIASD